MGWAYSEAQRGVRQAIGGPMLHSLVSGGRQSCCLQGKVKGGRADRLGWLWITKSRGEVKQCYWGREKGSTMAAVGIL